MTSWTCFIDQWSPHYCLTTWMDHASPFPWSTFTHHADTGSRLVWSRMRILQACIMGCQTSIQLRTCKITMALELLWSNPTTMPALIQIMQREWEAFHQDAIWMLVSIMRSRCTSCVEQCCTLFKCLIFVEFPSFFHSRLISLALIVL